MAVFTGLGLIHALHSVLVAHLYVAVSSGLPAIWC